ncbi:prepilin-type N-terminal cleavage/methylation domain-containing protein [Pseudomonas sp. BLCC-B13]|uniref:PilW family protein n=1 Tax=Pseudomonas sp. BLCC-B13 TaxID=3025314 RepID=UPI00234F9C92|nr:prepilin-type N-terminal cleavage/methylation domain-containing protein [Pseudomonas sp. BLCC-B13]MDC7823680.1 prepilin-type N-terminal cleavage/methylation domain-containing protein [Pseudomonas sp. BLCC-B13]
MNIRKQNGLSLVEIMVAVVISSILILGVTDLFNGSFMSGRSNSQVIRMQESGRLTLEIIGTDARRAGLWTCNTWNWEDKPIDDAVAVNGTSNAYSGITFKFVDPSQCRTATAAARTPKTITYRFSGTTLQKIEDGGTAQDLLENVTGSFTLLPDDSDIDLANAVMVNIQVASEDSNISARPFSATYEFKNRIIKQD